MIMMQTNTRPGYAYSDEYMAYRSKINSAIVPPILMISLSSILSSIAVGCCAFLELQQTYLDSDESKPYDMTWNIGLYAYERRDSIQDEGTSCYEYPDGVDLNSSWTSAKTFGVLCGVSSGVLAVFLWGWACCRMISDQGIGQAFTIASMISCLCCSLTFLFLKCNLCDSEPLWDPTGHSTELIDSECSLAWGGKCAISGSVFWFLSIFFSLRSKKILDTLPPFDELVLIVEHQTTPLIRENVDTTSASTDQEAQ